MGKGWETGEGCERGGVGFGKSTSHLSPERKIINPGPPAGALVFEIHQSGHLILGKYDF